MRKNSLGCVKSAMEIIGNKWTAQILRELSDGAKRFSELEHAIAGLNPRTLSKRLDELTCCDVIELANPIDTAHHSYQLTKKGEDLLPILHKMAEWSRKYPCSSTIA